MATATYKGQGEQDKIAFHHLEFKKGEAVEVTDPGLLAKLKGNPNFDVAGADDLEKPEVVPAPSAMGAQYPVEKPGEPRPLKPIPRAK